MKKYADPVIDQLDPGRFLRRRYFRDSCVERGGNYIKDLRRIGQHPEHTVIIDNSPVAYSADEDNALPIKTWVDDPNDTELIALLPLLDGLRAVHDVRSVLSRRKGMSE